MLQQSGALFSSQAEIFGNDKLGLIPCFNSELHTDYISGAAAQPTPLWWSPYDRMNTDSHGVRELLRPDWARDITRNTVAQYTYV